MIFSNVSFQTWCCLLGIFNLALGAAMLVFKDKAAEAMKAFPRSLIGGCVLSAVAFLWAAVISYVAPLDFFLRFKTLITVILVLSVPLSWVLIPDLLAARALGGVMVLLPAPILVASRLVDTEWRLVVVSLMYIYALAGMVFIMSPYYCRDIITWLTKTPRRFMSAGAVTAAVGVLMFIVMALA